MKSFDVTLIGTNGETEIARFRLNVDANGEIEIEPQSWPDIRFGHAVIKKV